MPTPISNGDYIPRIDMHRHLGGAIGPQFVWEVIQRHGLHHLAETATDVYEQMTFGPHEPRGFHRFLDKFKILDHIPWTEQLIADSIRLVCDDILLENLDYCWMRFSINKYMDAGMPWHRWQAIDFIHDVFENYAPGRVGLVLSMKYESSRAGQRQLAALIDNPRVAAAVIGIDLVGDEGYFNADFYRPIMYHWQSAGKATCAHVGESQSALNILHCIQMGLQEIAHGFRIWEYPDIVSQARDNDVCFNLALTSNYLTGCWTDTAWHPIRPIFDAGLACTIGTDDPIQCGCTLDSEHKLLREQLGFTQAELDIIAQTAVRRTARLRLPSSNLSSALGAAGKFTLG